MSAAISRVLFFASLRDVTETDELRLTLEAPITVESNGRQVFSGTPIRSVGVIAQ